jgi:hypothetical protein
MTCDNRQRWSGSTESRAAVAQLFAQSPPILVEVRFPSAATPPNWYLLDDEEEMEKLLERLGPQADLYLSSVWDLKNPNGAIRLKRS